MSKAPRAQPSQVAKSGNEPLPLPSKLTGVVIDSADKPISNAQVTLLIRTFSKDMHEEMIGPLAFTAMTDENGRYALAPTGTVHPNNEVRIKVVAKGFADVSDRPTGMPLELFIPKGLLQDLLMLLQMPIRAKSTLKKASLGKVESSTKTVGALQIPLSASTKPNIA